MHKIYWTSLRKVLFILPLFFMYGCGLWSNFTTFFNIYYNTRDDFNEAERLIYEVKRDPFSNEDMVIPSSAITLLNKVEVKASKILQFHGKTAFVDDALLMLGKSFYYQKNYQKALRKFQELILTQEDDDLFLEDSLWIGKTQMRLKEFDDALKTLNNVRATAVYRSEEDFFADAFIEEIKYYLFKEENSTAISLMNEFLELPGSNLIKAKTSFALGKLYLKTNDPVSAIKAFQKVSNFTSDFDIILDSRLGLAEAYRANNNPEDALNVLNKLRSEAKYSDNYNRIDLQIGLAYLQDNKVPEALKTFTKVDTSYPSTLSAGIAKFEKAKIYENKLVNFDSAYAYYMQTSSSSAPPETSLIANERATRFKKYQYISSLISDNKTQLRYVLDTTAFKADSIAFYSDTAKPEQDELSNLDNNETGRDPRGNLRDDRLIRNKKAGEEKRPPVKPVLNADSLKILIVKSEFDLANLFLTEMNRSDSAYYYYNDIVTNYPPTIYSGRTLYALAGYFQSINDSTKADSLYNIIYENYKTESVVNAAALKLNKSILDLNYDPAKQLYIDAENSLNNNNFKESVIQFYNIHQEFPKSPLAPKSLRAAGWVLENKLIMNDSAAAVYDSLLSKYPSSIYAGDVRQKVAVYKENLLAKQKEKEEALKPKVEPIAGDSVKTIQKNIPDYPNQPGVNSDSLNLQGSPTIDSLKKEDSVLKKNTFNQDSLNPRKPETDSLPGKK